MVQELEQLMPPLKSAIKQCESHYIPSMQRELNAVQSQLRVVSEALGCSPSRPLFDQETERALQGARQCVAGAFQAALALDCALASAALPATHLHTALQASVHAMSMGTPIDAAEEHAAHVQRQAGQGMYGTWGLGW